MKGESFLEGAIRELKEETGINCTEMREIYYVITDNTIYTGFMCKVDIDKSSIILQEGETISYRWVSKKEFLDFYKTDLFVPGLRNRLSNFIDNYFI